jgi:hypothetical protein
VQCPLCTPYQATVQTRRPALLSLRPLRLIRATRERGVGAPSSRSLAMASREATRFYGGGPGTGTRRSTVDSRPLAGPERPDIRSRERFPNDTRHC